MKDGRLVRQFRSMSAAFVTILSFGVAASSVARAELTMLPGNLTFKVKTEGVILLETLGGKAIECSALTGSGELTSARLGKSELKLTGCADTTLKVKCTGLSDTTAGNITVSPLIHYRHLLSPHEPDLIVEMLVSQVHFSCLGILFTMSGCQASDDARTMSNMRLWLAGELVTNYAMVDLVTNGDPAVTSVDTDNSLSMESCELLMKQEAGSAELAGSGATFVLEGCEVLGVSCTFLFDLSAN